MSLERFLNQQITIRRTLSGPGRRLPSGELATDSEILEQSVLGRIVPRAAARALGALGEAATDAPYLAVFAPTMPLTVVINDVLTRESDGLQFTAVGTGETFGEAGHGLTHQEVPCVIVGAGR